MCNSDLSYYRPRTKPLLAALFLALMVVAASIRAWTAAYNATDLGTLGGNASSAFDINAAGVVSGFAFTQAGDQRAAIFANGGVTDLGTLAGTFSGAVGINLMGTSVGNANPGGPAYSHVALFANGSATDLGTLGGTNSRAYGVNASRAGGGLRLPQRQRRLSCHAFRRRWRHRSRHARGTNSVAYGINASGEVVGDAYTTGDAANHAFVCFAGGAITDLNTLVVSGSPVSNLQLQGAGNHLNDWGQIAALATVGSGQTHAVRLDPASPITSVAGLTQDTKLVAGMSYRRIPAFSSLTGSGTVNVPTASQAGQTGIIVTLTYGEANASPAEAFYRIYVLP